MGNQTFVPYTGPIPTEQELEKMLDKVKAEVFMGKKTSAFLGSLLGSHQFHWDWDDQVTDTACVFPSMDIYWSPRDFMRSSPGERKATLVHEILHTGFMHFLRQGTRCPDIWNIACDYRINNYLLNDGHTDIGPMIFDFDFDNPKMMSEEEIYDELMKNPRPNIPDPGDLKPAKDGKPATANQQANLLGTVVRAVQASEVAGQAGNLPGNLREVLNEFLQPKINWRQALYRWMTELIDELEFTWMKPNRRYLSQDLYLQSTIEPEGRLQHLMFIEDVSGSIGPTEHKRINSEVKYVKDVLKPKKLTLVQFDTKIQNIKVYEEDDTFEEVELIGGGGTSLACVRELIEKERPEAAIIFSDLYCAPMGPLTVNTNIIWGVVNNKGATVPFGRLIQITED